MTGARHTRIWVRESIPPRSLCSAKSVDPMASNHSGCEDVFAAKQVSHPLAKYSSTSKSFNFILQDFHMVLKA